MTSQTKCAIHFSTGSGTLPYRLAMFVLTFKKADWVRLGSEEAVVFRTVLDEGDVSVLEAC
jgi:hypothetical protein